MRLRDYECNFLTNSFFVLFAVRLLCLTFKVVLRVFVNKPLTPKEEKEFSNFLKIRKTTLKVKQSNRTANRTKKELV